MLHPGSRHQLLRASGHEEERPAEHGAKVGHVDDRRRVERPRGKKVCEVLVGLSLGLFLLLMAGYYFGLIPGKIA